MIAETAREGALLDPVLRNKEVLAGDIRVGDSVGCSCYEMVEFLDPERRVKGRSRTLALGFRRVDIRIGFSPGVMKYSRFAYSKLKNGLS